MSVKTLNNLQLLGVNPVGKDTIEDTGLISESDASKVTPKKNLVVTTTPNPNQEGTFRNRVTL